MELLIEPTCMEHAMYCIKKEVPNIIVGSEIFSCRISHSFHEQEITTLVLNKNKTKIWVKVNAFFFEQDLNKLLMYLRWLSSIDIDYVIFQDYAIAFLNDEYNLNLKLHYNPETLVTNYGQFDFYKKAKFSGVFVARELMMNEVSDIANNKKDIKIELHGFGYGFIMHSRWKLITNFEDNYNIRFSSADDNDFLLIKEKLRKIPNLIYQDIHGTHMMTGYLINTINLLDKLENLKIDYLKLDFLKVNQDLSIPITDLYIQAIEDLKNNNYDPQNYWDKSELLINKRYLLSNGFLGGTKHILHMEKEGSDE